MRRPANHSVVDCKTRVALSVVRGEMSAAATARRHEVSKTSIGKRKDPFIRAGREGLAPKGEGPPCRLDARAAARVDELTRALGEAHVAL